MSIANILTLSRIFISPLFLLLYIFHDDFHISSAALPYFLLGLMVLTEFSDAIDGYLARRFNQVTDFGKIIDPTADSLCHVTMFLAFSTPPVNLPIWIVFLFFYRDIVISTLRTLCALRGNALAARITGKIKAIFQGLAAFVILVLMISFANGSITNEQLTTYATWIGGISAAYSFFSLFDYIFANRIYITRSLIPKKKQK